MKYLLTFIICLTCTNCYSQNFRSVVEGYNERVAKISKFSSIAIKQASQHWPEDIPEIEKKLSKNLKDELSRVFLELESIKTPPEKIAQTFPEYKNTQSYADQIAKNREKERLAKEKKVRGERAMREASRKREEEQREEALRKERMKKLKSEKAWKSSVEVDEFGDVTETKTYSLSCSGTMRNSATESAKATMVVFYLPKEKTFEFKMYDYGSNPVTQIGEGMKIAIKVSETGKVYRSRLHGKRQLFPTDAFDEKLYELLKAGHILKVSIKDDHTSRWNFKISGNRFPVDK